MKKLTYEQVKQHIESFGYKLLSDEYQNKIKLTIQCPSGHIYNTLYNTFKLGHRCGKCYHKNRNDNKKFTYEQVKEYIEGFDYKLLSKKNEYKNAYSYVKLQCPKNHIYEVKYYSFKNLKSRCPYCYNNKKFTYEQVKKYIESFDYRLISTEYINSGSLLEIKCSSNHLYKTKYNDFRRGVRCKKCWIKQHGSNAEKEILNYVKSIYNGPVIPNDRTQIVNPSTGNNLELDIWLPDLNKAIEYNGEHWHTEKNVKFRDNQKQIQCKEKGINLLVVKEHEWLKNKNWTMINEFIL